MFMQKEEFQSLNIQASSREEETLEDHQISE